MSTPRAAHTATLLQNGTVLIAGGDASSNTGTYLDTAEIYHPSTGTFTPTGNMTTPRGAHTATLLQNGKVLITGGLSQYQGANSLGSAELYDPTTGTFTPTGNMTTPRHWQQAVLLDSGKVLIMGGWDGAYNYLRSAELYDPATGTFTPTGSMHDPRIWFAATKLPNGKVLVAGGSQGYNAWDNTTELYDPSTGTFSYSGNLQRAKWIDYATILNNNQVLIAGGNVPGDVQTSTAELYDIATGTTTPISNMNSIRSGSAQILLPNGKVLIAGGFSKPNYLASAELYDPSTQQFTYTSSALPVPRYEATRTLLPNGKVLLVGGYTADSSPLASAVLYDTGNQPPVITTTSLCGASSTNPLAITLLEGQSCDVDVTATDPEGSTVTMTSSTGTLTQNSSGDWTWHYGAVDGPYSTTTTLTASDGQGGVTTATISVTVLNVPPTITSITSPVDPINVNDAVPVIVSAAYTDPGVIDTHTCTVDYGDGNGPQAGIANGGTCTGPSHIYTAVGVYTPVVTVTDNDGATTSRSADSYVVVYDPTGGSVYGAGAIDSPSGALTSDPSLSGTANFGFTSTYQKGATAPTGNTRFQFNVGNFTFTSTNYNWLVVNQNGTNAQFSGSGEVNRAGTYNFMLWAGDGTPDTFRILITDQNGTTVYDNGVQQAIKRGTITIN